MAKGAQYEREICKRLSLWWTKEENDDVFWRSEGSGGRAKRRGREGKSTYGSHGDLRVTNPIGSPLIDLLTIEIKRGYSKHTLQDVVDMKLDRTQLMWDQWIDQTKEGQKHSGSFSWLIISRRNARQALVTMPAKFMVKLREAGCFDTAKFPSCTTRAYFRIRKEGVKTDAKQKALPKAKTFLIKMKLESVLLDEFLEEVTPKIIRNILKLVR